MTSINLIFDEARRQLEIQLTTIESIDSKIGIMIGFTGVILGIVASIDRPTTISLILFRLGLLSLLISLVTGLYAFWFRKYAADPDPRALEKYYLREEEIKTKRQILANYVDSYTINKRTLHRKIKIAKVSLISLFVGVLLILISVL